MNNEQYISIYQPSLVNDNKVEYTQGSSEYVLNGVTYHGYPITDQCERSAEVMGENSVKLSFKLEQRIIFGAYAFIEYGGEVFYLREKYIPTQNGTLLEDGETKAYYYDYSMTFYHIENILDKFVCMRHIVLQNEQEDITRVWDEPEININGNLDVLLPIIVDSIKQASSNIPINTRLHKELSNFVAGEVMPNSDLMTFSFSGEKIYDVCTSIANSYKENKKKVEWYVDYNTDGYPVLNFKKREQTDNPINLSDKVHDDNGVYKTGGLLKCEQNGDMSNIPQTIIPFGSERNQESMADVMRVSEKELAVSFGKRLRLTKDWYDMPDGEVEFTDERGGLYRTDIQTGIEEVRFYEDIYPQMHFRVTQVISSMKTIEGIKQPRYTVRAIPCKKNADGTFSDYTEEQIQDVYDAMFPLDIVNTETLKIAFESGCLNGREFEVANKTTKVPQTRKYNVEFAITADGDIEDGTLLPYGSCVPREQSGQYDGDVFALFNVVMPESYRLLAEQELAEACHTDMIELRNTLPDVTCTTDPNFISDGSIYLGRRVGVTSDVLDIGDSQTFVSRVISFSHSLTKPKDITFKLNSAIVEGRLTAIENKIGEQIIQTNGNLQRAINLSRRAWRDQSEMASMLDSLRTEMMLVGKEKYQFAFSMAIEAEYYAQYGRTRGVHILSGAIQHTQEPYITYPNKGLWYVNELRMEYVEGETSGDANLLINHPDTAYYLYAICQPSQDSSIPTLGLTDFVLTTTQYSSEINPDGTDNEYLLLGILSSEFEESDGRKLRIFNRTNGMTSIAGGTLTTEQIQDYNRNLIIDFQNATIIARNGAKIKGNIVFQAYDENGQLKDEFTRGTTAIGGGTILSELLQLKDSSEQVTAGMSGRKSENILLWGGADYDNAQYASLLQNDFKKRNGQLITTLLKKDGTGKIGVFRIGDTMVKVVTDNGTIVIDADSEQIGSGGIRMLDKQGNERIIISDQPYGTSIYKPRDEVKKENENFLYVDSGGDIIDMWKEWEQGADIIFEDNNGNPLCEPYEFNTYSMGGSVNFFDLSMHVYVAAFDNNGVQITASSIFGFKVVATYEDGSTDVFTRTYNGGGISMYGFTEINIPLFENVLNTKNKEITNYKIYFGCSLYTYDYIGHAHRVNAKFQTTSLMGSLTYLPYYEQKTVIFNDGFMSAIDSKTYFAVLNRDGKQEIFAKGLPTEETTVLQEYQLYKKHILTMTIKDGQFVSEAHNVVCIKEPDQA